MFYLWGYAFHSGSSCQFAGKPIALMSIIGKSASNCCRCPFMSLLGETMSTNHLMMQISKNVLLGETKGLIHGRDSFLAMSVCICRRSQTILHLSSRKYCLFLLPQCLPMRCECVLECAACFVAMCLLGHLQQRIQIGTEPIIADVPDVMLRPP